MAKSKQLQKNYQTFLKTKNRSSQVLDYFRAFMPEMVYRTTKLEGEPVTKTQVKALFMS